jgi:hypothetical protein
MLAFERGKKRRFLKTGEKSGFRAFFERRSNKILSSALFFERQEFRV